MFHLDSILRNKNYIIVNSILSNTKQVEHLFPILVQFHAFG